MKPGEIDPKKLIQKDNVGRILDRALDAGDGLLRLTPTWVPRSFLHPGKRIKLHPARLVRLRRPPRRHRRALVRQHDRSGQRRPRLARRAELLHLRRPAVPAARRRRRSRRAARSARRCSTKYKRWPVYSKFFDNMGPIPHHMHQGFEDAKLVGQEGKPESYYFPPQLNNVDNNFAYTFMGLEPGTTKDAGPQVPGKLGQGRQRHPRPLAGLSPEARHRLADSARRAARPRLALHLRAAVGLRRVRHVPDRSSKAATCRGRCW